MTSPQARNPSSTPDVPNHAASPTDDEIDRLIIELRARGIAFLTGGHDAALEEDVARHPLPPDELLLRLASCPNARIRDATIALLLPHPDLAAYLPADDAPSNDADSERLIVLALAAIYLQRMWWPRLSLALGEPLSPLASRYWAARGLPDPDGSPDGLYAQLGLRALAVYEWQRTGQPFNYLATWQQQVDHLTAQSWLAQKRAMHGIHLRPIAALPPTDAAQTCGTKSTLGALGMPHAPRGGTPMSIRAPADRQRIEEVLKRLGQQAHHPGRLYLVGGTTMVYEGLRANTIEIDVLIEADNTAPLLSAIRGLTDALNVNIEIASPRDFIPLPAGWRERSAYIGRYGPLEVFHFDLYSMALSKIERGTGADFQDVVALVQSGRIDHAELDAYFHEVLPRIATEGLGGMDPDTFAAHYEYVKSLIGSL